MPNRRALPNESATICQFLFAGNATITLVSNRTGARFTYRVRESDDGKKFWVSLLTGSDNEGDFTYLGYFTGPDYVHGRKSPIGPDAPSAAGFRWFASQLTKPAIPDAVTVWHEGRCGACNRKLTVPASIESGIGPECAKRVFRAESLDLSNLGL